MAWTDPSGLKVSFITADFLYTSDNVLIARFDSPSTVENLFQALNVSGAISSSNSMLLDSSNHIYNSSDHVNIILQNSSFKYVLAGSPEIELFINSTSSLIVSEVLYPKVYSVLPVVATSSDQSLSVEGINLDPSINCEYVGANVLYPLQLVNSTFGY